MLDLELVRSRFPSLGGDWTYFDNGGGSQILGPVIERMNEWLLTSNVQLGASYELSRLAQERLDEAQAAVATLINAADPSEVVMGPSTTALVRTLADSVGRTIKPGDEIIVTNGDHEANIGPWMGLALLGAVVRVWEVDPESGELSLEGLEELLGERTRLVAVTHASNILGSINPIRQIADLVHSRDAWLCVDGVGFAPHRAVDVQAFDADFYLFSFYKTFGPHHAVLYGRRRLLLELPGIWFSFISEDQVPYKFQPGNVNYELSYSLLGLTDYLAEIPPARRSSATSPDSSAMNSLMGGSGPTGSAGSAVSRGRPRPSSSGSIETGRGQRAAIEASFGLIAAHEERLSSRLLDLLSAKAGVRVIGSERPDSAIRVPIISFVVDGMSSADVVREVDRHLIGIRYGNFYSTRLIEALALPLDDGVVRVSMVHYNTVEEVDRLVEVLDGLL